MENEFPIFTMALGLSRPWFIRDVSFQLEQGKRVLHIEVDHEPASKFEYQGKAYSVYDHHRRSWRHLNFFQHQCFVHARVPRVETDDGLVRLVEVPWARPGSSFTLLFEDDVVELVRQGLSCRSVAARLLIGDKRVFGIIRHRVSTALSNCVFRKVLTPLFRSIDPPRCGKHSGVLTPLG